MMTIPLMIYMAEAAWTVSETDAVTQIIFKKKGVQSSPPGLHRDTTETPPGQLRDTTGTPQVHHRGTGHAVNI